MSTLGVESVDAAAAIVAALKADATLAGMVGGRVYLAVPPPAPASPFVLVIPVGGTFSEEIGADDPADYSADLLFDVKAAAVKATDFAPLKPIAARILRVMLKLDGAGTDTTVWDVRPEATIMYAVREPGVEEERHLGHTFRVQASDAA